MKPYLLALAILMSSPFPASPQTRLSPDQVPATTVTPTGGESSWCPGESLTRDSQFSITIGNQWTPTTPCNLHFSRFKSVMATSSWTMAIPTGPTPADDEVVVYFTLSTPTAKQPTPIPLLNLRARNIAQLDLSKCTGCVASSMPSPSFPTGAIPVGLWPIRSGVFTPRGHLLMDTHQIFVGPGSGLVVNYTDGGYLFQILPPPDPVKIAAEYRKGIDLALAAQVSSAVIKLRQEFQNQLQALLLTADQTHTPASMTKADLDQFKAEIVANLDRIQSEVRSDVWGQLQELRMAQDTLRVKVEASQLLQPPRNLTAKSSLSPLPPTTMVPPTTVVSSPK